MRFSLSMFIVCLFRKLRLCVLVWFLIRCLICFIEILCVCVICGVCSLVLIIDMVGFSLEFELVIVLIGISVLVGRLFFLW